MPFHVLPYVSDCLALGSGVVKCQCSFCEIRNDQEEVVKHNWLVDSNIFHFHLYLGKISNLTNIFQMF